MLSFVLAAGHNVAVSFLTSHNTDYKWLALDVVFVNENDPDFIRYAIYDCWLREFLSLFYVRKV